MRRVLVFAVASALVPIAACVAAAVSSGSERSGSNSAASATLNPARPADRQMRAYGEVNPDCRMWTNWEKLCSRTGANGTIVCGIDPGRRVTPSDPFCAASRSATPAASLPETERVSSERFCRAHRTTEDLSRGTLSRVCTRHDPRRPFNGRRVAALLHRDCDGLSDAATGRPFCVRGGNAAAGLPDCEALAARGYQHPRLLHCSRWSGDASCRAFPIRPQPDLGPDAFVIPQDPNRNGVHGLVCENRKREDEIESCNSNACLATYY